MIPAERQKQILKKIMKEETVQVNQLSRKFAVSELTVRRDLEELSRQGLVERKFGGAILVKKETKETEFNQKAKEFSEEKEAIGRASLKFVEDGDTICINSGSTTSEVLKAILLSSKKVTIITNNIAVFSILPSSTHNSTVIFTGGTYRGQSNSVSGSLSTPLLDKVFANKAFIGVDGFSLEQGLTTPIQEEAVTTCKMIEKTIGRVTVVATGNKIGLISNYKTVATDKVDTIITDRKGGEILKTLGDTDLKIIIAN
ncbi:MAG: DeoR/GlpR family DNA-binding transcription regulator [Sphaerochaetaceae bacterium]